MAASYYVLFELYPWLLFAIAFVFGAVVGSFLNVVIARVPLKLSVVSPASHCFSCKTPIKGIDNIPVVSYFMLAGKCRHCDQAYSIHYAAVEFITGLLTAIIVSSVYSETQSFMASLCAAIMIWMMIALGGLAQNRMAQENKS